MYLFTHIIKQDFQNLHILVKGKLFCRYLKDLLGLRVNNLNFTSILPLTQT